MIADNGWTRVVYAADCPLCESCGDPWCTVHDMHYADCPCIGPAEDNVEYLAVDGHAHCRRLSDGLEWPQTLILPRVCPSDVKKIGATGYNVCEVVIILVIAVMGAVALFETLWAG